MRGRRESIADKLKREIAFGKSKREKPMGGHGRRRETPGANFIKPDWLIVVPADN